MTVANIALTLGCLFHYILASSPGPLVEWFTACRDVDEGASKGFGSAYLYERYSDREQVIFGLTCYEIILFDRSFESERHDRILREFVELGMPVNKYVPLPAARL